MRLLLTGLVVAVLLFSAVPAFAAQGQTSIDGSLLLATARASGFDAGLGVGIGATVGLPNVKLGGNASMAIRGDMSYFNWDGSFFGVDYSYSSLMFFGGPRIYFGKGGGKGSVMPYVEGGVELSFDSAEVATPFGKASDSEMHFGLAGGGGIEIPLSDRVKFGVSARLHLITDDFMSVAATIGTTF